MKILSGLLLCVAFVASAQPSIEEKIRVVTKTYPDLPIIGVIYNSTAIESSQIPNKVDNSLIAKIPVANLRDIAPNLNAAIKTHDVKAVFLLDDGGQLITNPRTVRFVAKTGIKRKIMMFCDAEDLDVKVTGTITSSGDSLDLELSSQ